VLFEVRPDGDMRRMSVDTHPRCALFEQQIVGDNIVVQLHDPPATDPAQHPQPSSKTLTVPLEPDFSALDKIHIDLWGSPTDAYRMPNEYSDWFANCFDKAVVMVYIGDGRRKIISVNERPAQQQGWLSSVTSYLTGTGGQTEEEKWLTFTDIAPYMVASEASLHEVNSRLPKGFRTEMFKFRPNIVVNGKEAWDEDYWGEVTLVDGNGKGGRLRLNNNCVRCASLNVDYQTGRMAEGPLGSVLKLLMKDRRVDTGKKYSPVFGRYGFLDLKGDKEGREEVEVALGDAVEVTKRNTERTASDWPT
jgi:uncharacterized protein YcbX